MEDDDGRRLLVDAAHKVLDQLLFRADAVQKQREGRVEQREPFRVLFAEGLADGLREGHRRLEELVHLLGQRFRVAARQVGEGTLLIHAFGGSAMVGRQKNRSPRSAGRRPGRRRRRRPGEEKAVVWILVVLE